jgi:isocitrate lyase
MTDSNQNANPPKPVLKFEDKSYDMNSLPDNVKELLKALQVADAQVKMHQDTINVLGMGRKALGLQLKQQLGEVAPIEEENKED